MKHLLKQAAAVAALGTILFALQLFAFTEPSTAPPGGNVPAPINTGSTAQTKAGNLTLHQVTNNQSVGTFVADILNTVGGAVLNTGGAPNGLIVDKGKVGIGTASPADLLHVLGDIRISGGGTHLWVGNNANNGWLGYRIRTSDNGGWRWQFVDGSDGEHFGVSPGGVANANDFCTTAGKCLSAPSSAVSASDIASHFVAGRRDLTTSPCSGTDTVNVGRIVRFAYAAIASDTSTQGSYIINISPPTWSGTNIYVTWNCGTESNHAFTYTWFAIVD